jgi:cobalt-zinc-cadmium efflux system outer membrane protein
MTLTSPRVWTAAAGLLLAAGCLYPVHQKIDHDVCDLAARPVDLQPAEFNRAPPMPPATDPRDGPSSDEATSAVIDKLTPASHQAGAGDTGQPRPKEPLQKKLEAPSELLLGQPPVDVRAREYRPLPALPADPQPAPGPEGRPLTLADLQRLARANSPLIVQAKANVESARGQAIQAGLPPNPTVRIEQDTGNTTGGPAYLGGGIEQVFKTANKLQLQRASATMDLQNAELAYRRAQTDLATRVRSGYFSVLVAQENMRIARALVRFVDTTYAIQSRRASREIGVAYPYEPLQLRAQARLARVNYYTVRQHYISSWKQLAATLGLIGLPPTELAGRIDIPVPVFDHEKVLTRVLQRHTDVRTADNTLLKARYNLQLARVTPIPDVDVAMLVQSNYTNLPLINTVWSVQISMPLPVWDRNQGGIIAAQANLIQSREEAHRVRTALTTSLATAYETYLTNLETLREYRTGIIPDQLKAYESLVTNFLSLGGATPLVPPQPGQEASPVFGDVASAQQVLIGYYASYFTALDALWQAVVNVADLLQTDDLFQAGDGVEMGEAPPCAAELERLPELPCFHPCSPLPDRRLLDPHGDWPSGLPALGTGGAAPMPPAEGKNGAAPPPGPEKLGPPGQGAANPTAPQPPPPPRPDGPPLELPPDVPGPVRERPGRQ